ncbi:MAG: hypothetical protein JWR26_2007 [Pedosphaera sp.]|nr:hypothetical protein [Pedosphaera sp.]
MRRVHPRLQRPKSVEAISQIAADGAARDLGRRRGVRREHPRSGAATDEQRSIRPKDRPFPIGFHSLLSFRYSPSFPTSTPPWIFVRWLQSPPSYRLTIPAPQILSAPNPLARIARLMRSDSISST